MTLLPHGCCQRGSQPAEFALFFQTIKKPLRNARQTYLRPSSRRNRGAIR